jgi:TPR repeat protein
MKNLTTTLCLTIAVLLGSVRMSESADYQKGVAAYESGDYASALREFKSLTEQGNGTAGYYLGFMYRNGKGVLQDHKTAVKWYRLAAEKGNADAQFNLGGMYVEGKGVIKDFVYAHMWWNIAALSVGKDAPKNRDLVAKRMNSNQIEKAQKLARDCVRKKYKGC